MGKVKKFSEMNGLDWIKESSKMWLFFDFIVDDYRYLIGHYYNQLKQNKGKDVIEYETASLKQRLVELQRIITKYNYENLIIGLEVVGVEDPQYHDLIGKYKYQSKGSFRTKLFQLVFNS
ncbi:hypothetical protein COF68_04625 [Bacillus toyonensis]|uniref:hypothetical protein n=1 Tax=Bacillus toyonensis TaxID=155322 RepID=UPI000BFE57FC|nr:hypothetical protein [Bacillus toyonensis]PHE64138.1 hypothetical protein COF68_04625 [Bacillus toyonensis]